MPIARRSCCADLPRPIAPIADRSSARSRRARAARRRCGDGAARRLADAVREAAALSTTSAGRGAGPDRSLGATGVARDVADARSPSMRACATATSTASSRQIDRGGDRRARTDRRRRVPAGRRRCAAACARSRPRARVGAADGVRRHRPPAVFDAGRRTDADRAARRSSTPDATLVDRRCEAAPRALPPRGAARRRRLPRRRGDRAGRRLSRRRRAHARRASSRARRRARRRARGCVRPRAAANCIGR